MTVASLASRSTHTNAAAKDLLKRLLPTRTSEFDLVINPSLGDDAFELSGGGDKPVRIEASSSLTLASGLNWYLKHYANSHFSWCGSRMEPPAKLPALKEPVRIESPYKWRYYFNYCTFSYSMAFWDWKRWEKEIDWMALNGINLPLAVVGQEATWQKVYTEFGLNDAELKEFFAGPAFLAWGWMGNLDGWGGPTPQSWIDGQRELQIKILARMRAFGIKPALPAFTGHVPPALVKHYPNLQVKQMENWAENFTGTFILDPTDPMFQKIGKRFIEVQTEIYGQDDNSPEHFYSCDSFNENSPPINDPAYLDGVGKQLMSAMEGADPKAVWVLQDWMFHFNPTNPDFWQQPQIKAFLESVPDERLLVLDLHSDAHPLWRKTESLCGKPWVWCFLHSFGGHQSMFGHMGRLAKDPAEALADPDRGQLVGFGLTAEGIEQNPVMYDLATDMMWRREAVDLDKWLPNYISRRYGKVTPAASAAWKVLRETAYNRPTENSGTVTTYINMPPRLHSDRVSLNYSPSRLVEAWRHLQVAAAELGKGDAFRFDLIDVGRQVMANLMSKLRDDAAAAHLAKDVPAFRKAAKTIVDMITDMDRLLATRGEFLLGRWLEAAKAWGKSDADRRLLEFNARAQITLWGAHDAMLRDYARKEWSGILRDYYAQRWQQFLTEAADHLEKGTAFDEPEFQKRLRLWEEKWDNQTNTYETTPRGDSVAVSAEILNKYEPVFAKAYTPVQNLALDKTATASAHHAGHTPEMALTGVADRCAFWSAGKGDQWWQVDLGAATDVDTVHVFPMWDNKRSYQYTVQTSTDGQSWQTVADASANTTPAGPKGDIHKFPTHKTRYVRINMTHNSANESKHLLDVRVYGPSLRLS
jgi:alpha-N-acetylglucosaminidase